MITLRLTPLLLAAGLALAPWAAQAQQQPVRETIAGHRTVLYTPAKTLDNGKRGLLVALHGCDQKYDDLWNWGNFQAAADAKGLVVAVPGVKGAGWMGAGCWDYGVTPLGNQSADEIATLTRTLLARAPLNIDPAQVYVVGLSSGAGLSLVLACANPDLFAGVGSIAGPSVGSPQMNAAGLVIPVTNIATAATTCRSLAGTKAGNFATQIANIAYGSMDMNPGNETGYPYSLGATDHAGQYYFVNRKWASENVEVLRPFYGTGPLSDAVTLAGGLGAEWNASANDKVRLTKLEIAQVGHAWPAGSGKPNDAKSGGVWMAQQGLDYPAYITDWFLRNNARATITPPEPVAQAGVACFSSSNTDHVKAGRAYDQYGAAYATGSNLPLGPDNPFLVTNLAQNPAGFFTPSFCWP